jgi:hypothetical protein
MIAAEFARFLGIPVTWQANITDIIEAWLLPDHAGDQGACQLPPSMAPSLSL